MNLKKKNSIFQTGGIKSKKTASGAPNFYVESPLKKDDVEEMKVRAQQVRMRFGVLEKEQKAGRHGTQYRG
jgi:hypothetical protein